MTHPEAPATSDATSAPEVGRPELGQDQAPPQTEAERQTQATVRSISRLEESS